MNVNKKIVVISGGFSEEREVSKISAMEISKALSKMNYEVVILDPISFKSDDNSIFDCYSKLVREIKIIDPFVVFIGLHGGDGEDGRFQALLDMANIPFTGSNHTVCAVAMDKALTNAIAISNNVPVPDYIVLKQSDKFNEKKLISKFGTPLIVKPNNSGSSFGVSIVEEQSELAIAMEEAFSINGSVMIQKFVDGRELAVTIIENQAYPIVEIVPKDGFYDFENKYTKGKTDYIVPANFSKEETRTVQKYAENICIALGCNTYSRVDFRFDGENFYFLEVNTLPGMTPLSLTPMAVKESGGSFNSLLEKIIELSQR